MISIFFKTIWNNRRRNILVFIELFMISLVVFNLTIFLVNMITIFRMKNCYDPKNVVVIGISNKQRENEKISEESFLNLKKVLSSNSFVESVSLSNNALPYNYNSNSTSFKFGEAKFNLGIRQVDIDYASAMKVVPLKGRWFDQTDIGKLVRPIVISKDIDEKYFQGNSLGKRIVENTNTYEIIGVVENFKRSDIERPSPFCFQFTDKIKPGSYWGMTFLIRTKDNKMEEMLAAAEKQVYSTINTKNWIISRLNSLENMKNMQNSDNAQRLYLTLIIAVFIAINVFLGVVGILWYNTNLRIHEIGTKRALGATGAGIGRQFLAENLFIGALGLVFIILLFIQIKPFWWGRGSVPNDILIKSFWISLLVMTLLIIISTWIPASIASKIHPATALKTE